MYKRQVLITRGNTPASQQVAQHGLASFVIAAATAAGRRHGKEHSWGYRQLELVPEKSRDKEITSDSVCIRDYCFFPDRTVNLFFIVYD